MAKKIKFIDSHAHLAMLEESPEAEILKRAKDANLSHIITVSTNETSWEPNRRLAATYPRSTPRRTQTSGPINPDDARNRGFLGGHLATLPPSGSRTKRAGRYATGPCVSSAIAPGNVELSGG